MGKVASLVVIGVILLPLVGIVAASNLSTAVIIMGIGVCMLFVASPKYSHFVIIVILGVAFVTVFIMFAGYRGDRIQAFLHPETAGDKGYQTLMGLYAIGSGCLLYTSVLLSGLYCC